MQTCEMVNKSSKSNLCYIDSDLIATVGFSAFSIYFSPISAKNAKIKRKMNCQIFDFQASRCYGNVALFCAGQYFDLFIFKAGE